MHHVASACHMTIKMANFMIARFGPSFILTILIIFATFHLNHSDPSRRFMRGWKAARSLEGWKHESLLGAPTGQYNGDLPPDQWFEQKLDHFDDANSKTWKQVC